MMERGEKEKKLSKDNLQDLPSSLNSWGDILILCQGFMAEMANN